MIHDEPFLCAKDLPNLDVMACEVLRTPIPFETLAKMWLLLSNLLEQRKEFVDVGSRFVFRFIADE